GRVAGAVERLGDAERERVVRGEDDVDLLAAAVERVETVLHLGLRRLRLPALDADRGPVVIARRCLARRSDELALVDVRLEDVPRPGEEELRVVVVRRTGEGLEVERSLGVVEVELLDDELALERTDALVVERRVVVDVLRVVDETV